jgi:hypothetical protein
MNCFTLWILLQGIEDKRAGLRFYAAIFKTKRSIKYKKNPLQMQRVLL